MRGFFLKKKDKIRMTEKGKAKDTYKTLYSFFFKSPFTLLHITHFYFTFSCKMYFHLFDMDIKINSLWVYKIGK